MYSESPADSESDDEVVNFKRARRSSSSEKETKKEPPKPISAPVRTNARFIPPRPPSLNTALKNGTANGSFNGRRYIDRDRPCDNNGISLLV